MQIISRIAWFRLLADRCVLLAFAALIGHTSPAVGQVAASAPCQAVEGPAYLGGQDMDRTSVVVFIHGVLSSAASAWGRDADHSWPCLLRNEPAFNNSNIYLYGYESSLLDPNPSIEKVARQLLIDLNHDEVLSHAHVTIVAHSMGGLVTARMLLTMHGMADMRQKLDRIKLVSFFGTPATGADIASVASQISYNVQFEEMKSKEDQQILINQWDGVPWPFAWYCLAEGKNTGYGWIFGTRVVPKESATALCRRRLPLGAETLERFDHITMVKPSSLQDPPHRYLRRYFMSCVTGALPRTYPPSEANSRDGQTMLQALNQLRASMSDISAVGRDALLAKVQETLYQSSGFGEAYVLPSNLGLASLVANSFDRLGSRPFALEFIKLFEGDQSELQPTWVGRFANLDRYLPDGQLTELRRSWTSAGYAQDSDFVLTLKPRANGEQVVILGSIEEVAGAHKGSIRGLLILPAQPKLCV